MNNINTFDLLSKQRIALIFYEHMIDNIDSITFTNKRFTYMTGKLHKLFFTNEYRSDVVSTFNVEKWADIVDGQRNLAGHLLFHLYELFTSEIEKKVRKQEAHDPVWF